MNSTKHHENSNKIISKLQGLFSKSGIDFDLKPKSRTPFSRIILFQEYQYDDDEIDQHLHPEEPVHFFVYFLTIHMLIILRNRMKLNQT